MNLAYVNELLNDKAFAIGFLLGALVFFLFWTYSSYMRTMYLIEKGKAENRTATKLGDKFYYIVPESEYVQHPLSSVCIDNSQGYSRVYKAPELDQYRSAIEHGEKKQKD